VGNDWNSSLKAEERHRNRKIATKQQHKNQHILQWLHVQQTAEIQPLLQLDSQLLLKSGEKMGVDIALRAEDMD